MIKRISYAVPLLFAIGCAAYNNSTLTDLRSMGSLGASLISQGAPGQASGNFTTLTYNVAGLLEPFSSSNPSDNTPIISCLIRDYDVVQVQEDFNYHAALYDSCDNHTYRSPTTGGMGIGSGLNQLSNFAYIDFDRTTWNKRSGSDALTPKGFTMARTRIADGVYIDFYNLHAQSETTDEALANSRSDVNQLLAYIEAVSAGNAVIVMGDTNTRHTRSTQNIGDLMKHGFTDVWIQLIRGGQVPPYGDALTDCSSTTSPNCEIVDKVFYRSSKQLTLTPTEYKVESAKFVNASGAALSDHWPVKVAWNMATTANRRASDSEGGPHGDHFNDMGVLPENPGVASVNIRSGSRVDRVGLTLTNGYSMQHGGNGGNAGSLTLNSGEVVVSAQFCSAQYNGHTRIFYARFTTSNGRVLAGGAMTSSCTTYNAAAGWQIAGFWGRSGDEVDRLGVVYAPITASPSAATYYQFVNRLSGLCADISGGTPAAGTNVLEWYCSGNAWQKWSYDAYSGLIRSKQNPAYCLDNSGVYADGANIMVWPCTGNGNQQFTLDSVSGRIASRLNPGQVLDGANNGTAAGTNVQTWSDWGGATQRWNFVP